MPLCTQLQKPKCLFSVVSSRSIDRIWKLSRGRPCPCQMKKAPDTLFRQDSSFQGTIIGRAQAGFISASEKQKQGKFLNIVQVSRYKYRSLAGKLQYGEALGACCCLNCRGGGFIIYYN